MKHILLSDNLAQEPQACIRRACPVLSCPTEPPHKTGKLQVCRANIQHMVFFGFWCKQEKSITTKGFLLFMLFPNSHQISRCRSKHRSCWVWAELPFPFPFPTYTHCDLAICYFYSYSLKTFDLIWLNLRISWEIILRRILVEWINFGVNICPWILSKAWNHIGSRSDMMAKCYVWRIMRRRG